jgi:hypothetical protein
MTRTPDDADEGAASNNVKSPAGRVEIDARGRSVWRWARDVLDSTSVLLKRLENRDLALEATQKVPIQRGAKDPPKRDVKMAKTRTADKLSVADSGHKRGGGFDPYNSR